MSAFDLELDLDLDELDIVVDGDDDEPAGEDDRECGDASDSACDEVELAEAGEMGPLPHPIRRALDAERRDGWQWQAPCASADPQAWFPDENPLKVVLQICAECPVRRSCLATALLGNEIGIWAGTSANQRRQPRRALRDGRPVTAVLDDLLALTGSVGVERGLGERGMTATLPVPVITAVMARELAASEGVCARPILRRVTDQSTGAGEVIPIRCGSTRESVCPACAQRARVLRMQQCAEGWHRTVEPEVHDRIPTADQPDADPSEDEQGARRVRSTRRRDDAPDLPRLPVEDRTVGRVFTSPDGQQFRPSMFLTLTLPSYGPVLPSGAPRFPGSYDYRRAALDALVFSRLVDRFWQNLRRCAGYRAQYFAAVEPQLRLTLHLHAAIRGAIQRAILRQVVAATYVSIWWPSFDTPVYVDRVPEWTGAEYADPGTGEILPTWDDALDTIDADPSTRPVHVARFGTQVDIAGIIAPSEDADRAVRYLTKYLTKSIADAHAFDDGIDAAYEQHVDRLHQELEYLPCSETCANWLRYGIQPKNAGPGLIPGRCMSGAHDRENLGHNGRRVLVSRDWSGKTLSEHKADRATVVREALAEAGVEAPEIDRLAASVLLPDGRPRFRWSDLQPDSATYTQALVASVVEAQRWRAQYDAAKTILVDASVPVDSRSAIRTGAVTTARPPPIPS